GDAPRERQGKPERAQKGRTGHREARHELLDQEQATEQQKEDADPGNAASAPFFWRPRPAPGPEIAAALAARATRFGPGEWPAELVDDLALSAPLVRPVAR